MEKQKRTSAQIAKSNIKLAASLARQIKALNKRIDDANWAALDLKVRHADLVDDIKSLNATLQTISRQVDDYSVTKSLR